MPAESLLVVGYAVQGLLACLGLHRLGHLVAAYRLVDRPGTPPTEHWPPVLVQVPLFNEPLVGPRLIDALARLDYPRESLRIQVLDDSRIEDQPPIDEAVARAAKAGIRIDCVRRAQRSGFKAGALAEGLRRSDEPLVAIFDADFIPPADFLKRTVGEFADPAVAMVQARWSFLNAEESLLTRAQSAALEAHFAVEQRVRAGTGLLFNFNGTAGIWRRAAIEDAGGWRSATLTEDLDLSFRAQLRGWHCVYRHDVEVPSELPSGISALRSQQRRWTRGSLQCARLLLGPVWRSGLGLRAKLEATAQLLGNLGAPAFVILLLVMAGMFFVRQQAGLEALSWLDLVLVGPCTLLFAAYFAAAGRLSGRGVLESLGNAILVMTLYIGLAFTLAWAAMQGLVAGEGTFVRTPKAGAAGIGALIETAGSGRLRSHLGVLLGLIIGVGLMWRAWDWEIVPAFWGFSLVAFGFAWVFAEGLREAWVYHLVRRGARNGGPWREKPHADRLA